MPLFNRRGERIPARKWIRQCTFCGRYHRGPFAGKVGHDQEVAAYLEQLVGEPVEGTTRPAKYNPHAQIFYPRDLHVPVSGEMCEDCDRRERETSGHLRSQVEESIAAPEIADEEEPTPEEAAQLLGLGGEGEGE